MTVPDRITVHHNRQRELTRAQHAAAGMSDTELHASHVWWLDQERKIDSDRTPAERNDGRRWCRDMAATYANELDRRDRTMADQPAWSQLALDLDEGTR